MARTDIPVVPIDRVGVSILTAADTVPHTTDGAKFSNDGSVELLIRNTGAGAHTVTIQTPQTVEGLAVAELSIGPLAAAACVLVGRFPPATFNQQSGTDLGYVYVDVVGGGVEVKFQAHR
jgi:hypothetical protein